MRDRVHYFMAVFIQNVAAIFIAQIWVLRVAQFPNVELFSIAVFHDKFIERLAAKYAGAYLAPLRSVFVVFFLFENFPRFVEAQMSQNMRHVIRK